ncbi:MAG TPA: hypothetical protein V6D07_18795 [Trichocoleus sp.]
MAFNPARMQRTAQKQRQLLMQVEEVIEDRMWSLLPGPQTTAAETEAFETLFGGRAGGGKSALLLILASQHHQNSVIFRRVYPNLKEMILKSQEMLLGTGASYNSQDKIWRGLPGGRILEFGAVQLEDSKFNYRGRAHDLKCFDELTEFSESIYEFLIGWTRTHIRGQRCRVISTCNPPSSREGTWVKKRWAPWIDPKYKGPKAGPGEVRYFARLPSMLNEKPVDEQEIMTYVPKGSILLRKLIADRQYEIECPTSEPFELKDGDRTEMIEPVSRTFIPATLADNPFIDSTYRRTLMAMPEPVRSQLLYGDFSIDPDVEDEWQLIPTKWVKMAQERWQKHPPTGQSALGVDVARGGEDNTVIAARHYTWVAPLKIKPGASVPSGKDSAIAVREEMVSNDVEVYVDVVGVGSSCFDFLIDMEVVAWACNAGERSDRLDRSGVLGFPNKRSQWAWNLREIFNPDNGYQPAIPPDDVELEEELITPRWEKRGDKIYVESREELMKADRLGRSPDRLSSLMLAFSDFRE